LLFCVCALATPLAAAPRRAPVSKYPRVMVAVTPRPRPALRSDAPPQTPEPPMDMTKAMPANQLGALPSSANQLGQLKAELAKTRPALASAKAQSEALAAEARGLRQKLVDTAVRIEALERESIALDGQIAVLKSQDDALTQSFARDRVSVTRLLAILERLQHDMPPALAVRPDDALAAARGAMLVGDTLPPVYEKVAALAGRIDRLKATRQALQARRAEAARNADALARARVQITQLSAEKDREASGAADRYSGLKASLADIAAKATDFQTLVARVAQLRRGEKDSAEPSIVTVTADGSALGPLTKGSLLPPVVGTAAPAPGGPESAKNPGITFAALGGAQVIAPADGKVLFAGPYHKSGQVLILEITTGYDLVLAGLGRVTVRPNDELLAGEPVGTMPESGPDGQAHDGTQPAERLYFELRENGRGLDPTPWLSLELRKARKT
jgi:septal ring factor EnvC (AmiA/AmiB activator)